MAKKYLQGTFTPKNPKKYVGSAAPIFRSSWEYQVMSKFDEHSDVIAWSSEPVDIPYRNPLTGRHTVYRPDFLVQYVDKANKTHVEMLEIKPLKETVGYTGVVNPRTGRKPKITEQTKLIQIINAAKWQAAQIFCSHRGWTFRVIDETMLHAYTR